LDPQIQIAHWGHPGYQESQCDPISLRSIWCILTKPANPKKVHPLSAWTARMGHFSMKDFENMSVPTWVRSWAIFISEHYIASFVFQLGAIDCVASLSDVISSVVYLQCCVEV
jgi:hypothetical protein